MPWVRQITLLRYTKNADETRAIPNSSLGDQMTRINAETDQRALGRPADRLSERREAVELAPHHLMQSQAGCRPGLAEEVLRAPVAEMSAEGEVSVAHQEKSGQTQPEVLRVERRARLDKPTRRCKSSRGRTYTDSWSPAESPEAAPPASKRFGLRTQDRACRNLLEIAWSAPENSTRLDRHPAPAATILKALNSTGRHQAFPDRVAGEVDAVVDFQRLHDPILVRVHTFHRDVHLPRNVFHAEPKGEVS